MSLIVREYLLSGNSLDNLKAEHGVKHHVHNNKICLTYDQIEAKESDKLSQQCRGLVLRNNKDYDIVAYPFNRFFNLEQKELAAQVDWNNAKFYDKVDGTLIICYFDFEQNKWCVGTRSRSEADGNIDGGNLTFAQLFDMAVKKIMGKNANLQDFMRDADQYNTYCFELTSPYNRIVCYYEDIGLTLLGVRSNFSLKENDPSIYLDKIQANLPTIYDFKNINHMIQVVREWDPKEKEGVVVCDANFNRVKVKNPAYIAYNHMRDSLITSWRGCAEVILLGKEDNVISMMPAVIADRIKKLKPVIGEVLKKTQEDYEKLRYIDNMKEFALKAQQCLWPAALFALKRGKASDLKTFALGNKENQSKIPTTATKTILELCKKIDGSILEEFDGED